ncbi:polymeric immunoglobulin receptor-like isoform X2 [Eucyclogobius newberryi]|uniref:polymeric immunoglobulin receptor-like isoform X2 n=1 Tax=Eucyclogobius newberryi TaxID=166745 RepID=UPI003B5961C5
MWTSRKLLFGLFFMACGSTAESDVVEVYAYVGGEAKVSCSYPVGYESYEKYLCAKNCGDDDILVTTTQGTANRYSSNDHVQMLIFTVTISNVQSSDAGKYWCGVSKNGKDIYTEVTVHVQSDECCDSVRTIQGYEGNSVFVSCPHQNEFVNSFQYMCNGSQPSACLKQALVTTNTRQNGQFRVVEPQGEFTVELTGVTHQDAGSYLCGIQRSNNFDVFSRVDLTVKEWCCVASHDVKGFLGQSVTLQCPYPAEHRSNTKFLCKGDRQNTCQTVVTGAASTDRFRLQDSSSSFSVTITGLRRADTGTYWCGSDSQWTPGKYYTRLHLTLGYLKVSTVSPTMTSITNGSQSTPNKDTAISRTVLYGVPGLLLILVVVTSVIVFKSCLRTKGKNKISSAKEELSVNVIYRNEEVVVSSTVKGCCRDDEDVNLYEDFSNEQIYANC